MDLINEFGLATTTPLKIPMDIYLRLQADSGDFLRDPHPYQRLLGKLIYLTITHPDIAFSVNILTQFMQNSTSHHMGAATKLVRYIHLNPGQGILLASSTTAELKA